MVPPKHVLPNLPAKQNWQIWQLLLSFLPPAYVVRGKVMFWQASVLPSIHLSVHRGGYPYPIMLCNISQNAMRQRGGTQTPPGGYPGQVPPPGGTRIRYPPGGVPGPPRGVPGPPQGGTRVRYPPGGYPDRTTEGVLTTRRAVCLLRSRRRTFLLFLSLISDSH